MNSNLEQLASKLRIATTCSDGGLTKKNYVVNDSNDWESNRFYLCYEDRFVDITFDWPVTEDQMAIVASILG